MSSQRIYGQQPTTAQRAARAMSNPNEPTACKKCGSIFFMEITAQMYTSGSYGFRAVSTMPMKVYVCPCGEIQTPPGFNSGVLAGGERDLFAQSIAAAVAYRAETGVDAAAKGFAGVHELRELKAEVEALKEQLRAIGITPIPGGEENEVLSPAPGGEEEVRPADEPRGDVPLPIATGNRGRSEAGSTEPNGEVKFIPPMQRPTVEGGARARMRRQGK